MILGKVKSTIKRYRLIDQADLVLIGVSGGPDSVALLYLLRNLAGRLKLKLHIAHLDHMLRGDSRKDAEFVERLAQKLKVPITSTQINVRGLAKKGSLEEIARNARLGFLFNLAKAIKADKIALGHNLDDQAETVLMRILRGTGLHGLSGILPKRDICGFTVIRPLIEVKRKQIHAYLKKKKIKVCIDASNFQEVYLRNRVRHKLIPLLEKDYNKNIKEVLSSLAESAGLDYDFLMRLAKRKMQGRKSSLPIDQLLRLDPSLRRLAYRQAISAVQGDTRRITSQHIREIEDLVLSRPLNSIVDLPKGISAVKKKCLSFYRKKNQ